MPDYGDWDSPSYGEWSEDYNPKTEFWDAIGNDEILDNYMSDLMQPGITDNERQDIFDSMAEYLDWEYDIDLNDVWDWEDFRAHYESG